MSIAVSAAKIQKIRTHIDNLRVNEIPHDPESVADMRALMDWAKESTFNTSDNIILHAYILGLQRARKASASTAAGKPTP